MGELLLCYCTLQSGHDLYSGVDHKVKKYSGVNTEEQITYTEYLATQ